MNPLGPFRDHLASAQVRLALRPLIPLADPAVSARLVSDMAECSRALPFRLRLWSVIAGRRAR